MDKSDCFRAKVINIIKIIITILGVSSITLGLWLYFICNETHLAVWFPIFFGAVSLYTSYRIHKVEMLNNGTISDFQTKCLFLSYACGTFSCLTYLAIVLHDVWQSIGFACFTLFTICIEMIICCIENKKSKK